MGTEKVIQSDKRAEGSLFSNSVISSHLRELGYPENSIISMNKCQENTSVSIYGHDEVKDELSINTIRHWCDLRTCPYCAKKHQRKFRRKYIGFLKSLPKTRMSSLYFLTISPKNYKNLEEGLTDIRKNFNKFLRLKYIKERIDGCIYVIETTQAWKGKEVCDKKTGKFLYTAKEDSWHVHIHAIVYGRKIDNIIRGSCNDCNQNSFYKNYLDGKYYCKNSKCNSNNVKVKVDSKIVSLWKQSAKGQDVNMHITKQKNPSHTLNYMLKYISSDKKDFKNEKSLAKYIVAIRGKRLTSTTGIFYNANFEEYKTKLNKSKDYTYFTNSFELASLRRKHERRPKESRADKYRRLKKEKVKKVKIPSSQKINRNW